MAFYDDIGHEADLVREIIDNNIHLEKKMAVMQD